MRYAWRGLGLLLVVPWLAGCVSGPQVRLDTDLVGRGPRLPGFGRAALMSPVRMGVRLEAAGQVSTVVVGARELVVGLAPTAVAANALGSGGGALPPKKGRLTGKPTKPSDNNIEVMKKQLLDWPIPGLKEVIAIKDGKLVLLFP